MQPKPYRPLVATLCPHWWSPLPYHGDGVEIDPIERKQCVICGKQEVRARVPEPNRDISKQQYLAELEGECRTILVDEWVPRDEYRKQL